MKKLSDLNNIKSQLPTEPTVVQPKAIKSNLNTQVIVTDHAVERYFLRAMNNTRYDIGAMRQSLLDKIYSQGVKGFYDQQRKQSYIAIINEGIFILKGSSITTFIGLTKMNRQIKDIYLALKNKAK